MKVRSYQDLIVWQKAMDLVELVYASSKNFPREEIYGLTSQLRKAAVSIPSKHCRRSRQTHNCGLPSALVNLLRIAARARNANLDRFEATVFAKRRM